MRDDAVPRLRLTDFAKAYGGVHALRGVSLDRAPWRDPRPLRRERRRQVDTGQDPGRRDRARRRNDRARRRDRPLVRPGDRPPPGHRRHLPGAELRPDADGRRKRPARAAADIAGRSVDWEAASTGRRARSWRRSAPDLDPRPPVAALPVAERQIVEIARALSLDARVIVMDEPTAALNQQEATVSSLWSVAWQARGSRSSTSPTGWTRSSPGRPYRRAARRCARHVWAGAGQTRQGRGRSSDGRRSVEELFPRRESTPGPADAGGAWPCPEREARRRQLLGSRRRDRRGLRLARIRGRHAGESALRSRTRRPGRGDCRRRVRSGCRHPAGASRAGIALVPGERKEEGLVLGIERSREPEP